MTREEFNNLPVAQQRKMLYKLVFQLAEEGNGRLTRSQYDRQRPDWAPTSRRLLHRCGFCSWRSLAAAWGFDVSPSDSLPAELSPVLCEKLADKGIFQQLSDDHKRQVAVWCLYDAWRRCDDRRLTQPAYARLARPGWPLHVSVIKALGAKNWYEACRSCDIPAGDPLNDDTVNEVVTEMMGRAVQPQHDRGFHLLAKPTGQTKRWYDWNRRCWVTSKVYVGRFV